MKPARLVAFHLPQFHPIAENDAWWGEGFTEWTNVRRGRPFFPGHRQPQLPASELGFYDLREDAARAAQGALARRYGIDAFCYYYYWFGGKRLLERPLEAMLAGGAPDLPFCLCWANENWTRRWDGKDEEILIAQRHSPEDDVAMIRDLIRHFGDPRYLRVAGKPLFIVYQAGLLPDASASAGRWRDECRRAGIGEIYLCAVRRFGMPPSEAGFDALIDFPPHGHVAAELGRAMPGLDPAFEGRIFDYRDLVRDAMSRLPRGRARQPNYPAVMPCWDNTARKGTRAHVFHGATPLRYRAWLAEAIRAAGSDERLAEPMVFINAWNEWAEGCHLEPDADHGAAWLEATQAARLDAARDERLWDRHGTTLPELPLEAQRRLAGAPLEQVLAALARSTGDAEIAPTPRERLIAYLRRRVEPRAALRRAALPVAKFLGLAD